MKIKSNLNCNFFIIMKLNCSRLDWNVVMLRVNYVVSSCGGGRGGCGGIKNTEALLKGNRNQLFDRFVIIELTSINISLLI